MRIVINAICMMASPDVPALPMPVIIGAEKRADILCKGPVSEAHRRPRISCCVHQFAAALHNVEGTDRPCYRSLQKIMRLPCRPQTSRTA